MTCKIVSRMKCLMCRSTDEISLVCGHWNDVISVQKTCFGNCKGLMKPVLTEVVDDSRVGQQIPYVAHSPKDKQVYVNVTLKCHCGESATVQVVLVAGKQEAMTELDVFCQKCLRASDVVAAHAVVDPVAMHLIMWFAENEHGVIIGDVFTLPGDDSHEIVLPVSPTK